MLIIKDYKTPGQVDWAAVDEECDIRLGIKPAPDVSLTILKTTRPENPACSYFRHLKVSCVIDEDEFLSVNIKMLPKLTDKHALKAVKISSFIDKISRIAGRFPTCLITVDQIKLALNKDSSHRSNPVTMMYLDRYCHIRHNSRLVLTKAELEAEKLLFVEAVNNEINRRGVVTIPTQRNLIGIEAALRIINSYQPESTIGQSKFRRMIARHEVPTVETGGTYLRFDPAVIREWIEQELQLKEAS